MLTLTWLRGLLARRAGRLSITAIGVALAVGLLATLGSFLSASKAQMTDRALKSVSVDWQVETQPGADPQAVLTSLKSTPGIKAAIPVGYGDTKSFETTTGATVQTTGAGVIVGYAGDYRSVFPNQIRDLAGATTGVLLFQQTAANLHAAPGDQVTVTMAGLPPVTIKIDGVIDLPEIDAMFQKVGAPPQSQRSAPPDNVILVPLDQWHRLFDPLAINHPELVSTQVHVDLVTSLPHDPAAAYSKIVGDAHNLELKLTGQVLVGNNLGAKLAKARSDSLYAQILFLFLGTPGAVLAGMLTVTVAASGADRRRREQALLRTRGANSRQLLSLGLSEAIVVGAAGSILGLGLALLVGRAAFGTAGFGATSAAAVTWAAFAVGAGLTIAAFAIAVPAWRDARDISVVAARQTIGRRREPRWQRLWIDVILICASLLVFWLTGRNGYKLVLAVEGVTTISVNYWAFLAPALMWLGVGMFTSRIASFVLRRGRRPLAWLIKPMSAGLSDTVAASMSRQRRLIARGVTLVALTAGFAVSTSVFNSTYQQQAEVDAILSNGADVTVIESPGASIPPNVITELSAIQGVRKVSPLMHRFAYVGNDLQDIYGVNPTTIVSDAKLQDSYFQGGSATSLMTKLAHRPDAALFSFETVKDFQLAPGDTVTLRLQSGTTKQYVQVPFTYTGVVKKFPSAPSDSFVIGNAGYIAKMTGIDHVGTYLIATAHGDSTAVAGRVQTAVGTNALVNDVASKRRKIGSSLTSVEMAGLTKVELGFALTLAAAAAGLVLWLGLNERRRTFATAAALGAKRRQLGGFVWSEAIYVTVGGLVTGAAGGWVLTNILVKILTGVFDPPPTTLAVPWAYLALVAAVTVAAVVIAASSAIRSTRRPAVQLLRDI